MDERNYLGDLGDSDSNIPEEGPTTPPPGWLENVTGYDQNHGDKDGTDKLYPPPPDYATVCENDRNLQVPTVSVPVVSEDVAREALMEFVERKWTYRSKPARDMTFTDLKPFTVYRYRLETYTESRSSTWEFEPYTNQFVDGPQYGASPLPWDVPVEVPPMYTNVCLKVRVPHSSVVKVCHQCHGRGKVKCNHCRGKGETRCMSCHGTGRKSKKRCSFCRGSGRRRCSYCSGKGHKTCKSCLGHQNLLHFIQLTVTWKNHVFEFVPDRIPEFPIKKFDKVSGDAFFVEESIVVYPVMGFPDLDICNMSQKMIEEHLSKFSTVSRILHQCQSIELVPLTRVFYTYKGKDFNYFVYGIENKVYTPKYPSSCSIL
ncbi:protein SSUH2 homolog isoform X1 [Anguilla rostrata]|uniref:protein SSUH2 homolog isoform X1 n=1 Tax=Anguilla rostrata TaxID=7938 RepID=UPI0030CAC944